ncbi:MAG: hypothetical protein JNJ77_19170 [Planctomycetia bacterium]|nr:hypothetical protein [Planctomycetia bacterium]
MQRAFGLAFLLVLCATLSGCGNSNDALAQDLIGAMNEMADAAESGNKTKIQTATTRFARLLKEYKNLSAEESKRIQAKYQSHWQAASKRMEIELKKAIVSGKISPPDMMSISELMLNMK